MESLCKEDVFGFLASLNRAFSHSGSGIFGSSDPAAYARAIVEATTHYNNPLKIAEVCTGLGAGMKGENDLNRPGLTSESPTTIIF